MDDLISRKAAIDAVIKRDANCGIDSAEVLKALPSADVPDKNVGDTISKQAALDALNHELRCGAVINLCGLEVAYEVIEGLPAAKPQVKYIAKIMLNEEQIRDAVEKAKREILAVLPRWIPCSERLPDKEDVYLCCSTSQDIWILRYMMPYYFQEGAFIQFDGDYPVEFSDVIAWMKLPKPYGGEQIKEAT